MVDIQRQSDGATLIVLPPQVSAEKVILHIDLESGTSVRLTLIYAASCENVRTTREQRWNRHGISGTYVPELCFRRSEAQILLRCRRPNPEPESQ